MSIAQGEHTREAIDLKAKFAERRRQFQPLWILWRLLQLAFDGVSDHGKKIQVSTDDPYRSTSKEHLNHRLWCDTAKFMKREHRDNIEGHRS